MSNFIVYAILLLVLITGFIIVKKVAGCIVKSIVLTIVLAIVAFIYFMYIRA